VGYVEGGWENTHVLMQAERCLVLVLDTARKYEWSSGF